MKRWWWIGDLNTEGKGGNEMPKAECPRCGAQLAAYDDVLECEDCGAVIRVLTRNPLELELVEPAQPEGQEALKIKEAEVRKAEVESFSGVNATTTLPLGIEPNWNQTLKIWWAWSWRQTVICLFISGLTRSIGLLLDNLLPSWIPPAFTSIYLLSISAAGSFAASVFTLKLVIDKSFTGFHLVLRSKDGSVVQSAQIRWKMTLEIWWAYTWRLFIMSFLGGVGVGTVVRIAASALGYAHTNTRVIGGSLGGILWIFISIIMIRLMLEKDFGDFRLALIVDNV